jgi:hypothetical protein
VNHRNLGTCDGQFDGDSADFENQHQVSLFMVSFDALPVHG